MPRGRAAEAARNDETVLAAARAELIEDAGATMAAIARSAGVGVGSLYRRYRSREELIAAVCVGAMDELAALADGTDDVADFLRRALDGAGGALKSWGGPLPPGPQVSAAQRRLQRAVGAVLGRAQRAGTVRTDVVPADLSTVLQQATTIRVGDAARTLVLRHRALDIALAGLRPAQQPLCGPAPSWAEVAGQHR